MRKLLLLTCLLTLTGCMNPFRPPQTERQTQWARMGIPGYVTEEKPGKPQVATILIRDENGKLVPSKARIDGMVVLDEPTFEYYRKLDAEKRGLKD